MNLQMDVSILHRNPEILENTNKYIQRIRENWIKVSKIKQKFSFQEEQWQQDDIYGGT